MSFWNSLGHGFIHGIANNYFGGWSSFGFGMCGFNPFLSSPFGNFGCYSLFSYTQPFMNFNFMNPNISLFNPYSTYGFNNVYSNFDSFTFSDYSLNSINMNPFAGNIIRRREDVTTDKPADVGSVVNETPKPEDKSKAAVSAKELKEKWNKRYPESQHLTLEFYEKIIKISKKINCDPNDLMGVINIETAGSFKASAQNGATKATGLIQFMPKTAESMGTTVAKLAKMSEIKQLDFVEKYLLERIKTCGVKGKLDAASLYSLVFWPKAANKDDNYLIANKGSKVYNLNKGLDANNDSKITKADLGRRVLQYRA